MFQQSCYVIGLLCLFLLLASSSKVIADRIRHVSKKELPGIKADEQVRTIREAASLVKPGDTVIIHNGIYREKVVIERNIRQGRLRLLSPNRMWHFECGWSFAPIATVLVPSGVVRYM